MLTEQQQLAVDTVDQHVLVSAGAGSGKTHVLVERYVEILRRYPDTTLGNIIAVTFTRKAASEMRSRLKAKFLSLSKSSAEIENGKYLRWLGCLSEVDSARIGTIHSLCESILKAYPADSGIDPESEVLDELTRSELVEESVDVALREVIAAHEPAGASMNSPDNPDNPESGDISRSDAAEYTLLLSFPFDEIKRMVASLIGASMQFDEAIKIIPELDSQSFITHAEKFIKKVKSQELASLNHNRVFKRAFDYARANVHPDPANKLELSRALVLQLCEDVCANGGEETLQSSWRALIEIAQYSVGNVGGNKPEAKELRANLKIIKEAALASTAKIPLELAPQDEPAINFAIGMIEIYRRAQAVYQKAKEERTSLDYNDLIGRARTCLTKEGSQARGYFNERVKALLVDEFQDTNDVQAELLSMLAGPETRVFFIGDDKQSIYKFQGADVATFNRWKQRLASQSTDLVGQSIVTKLTKSFRSHPLVVDFVNAIFAKLLDGDPEELPYVAAFEALEPARQVKADALITAGGGGAPDSAPEAPTIDVVLYNEDEGDDMPASEMLEACHVANWIKTKVDGGHTIEEKGGVGRPLAYGDFAVLVSKNKDFAQFEEVFARTGIPYVTFGGSGFLRRQEVTDFENLFRFLDNPKDSHSLLAVLRSPLCPLTDDVIHNVVSLNSGSPQSAPLWVLLTEAGRQRINGYPSIMQAVRLLRTMLDYASLLPLGELTHKIITLTRYDLALMVAGDGKQRSRNVWKIAHLARDNEHLSCGEFAAKIRDMRDFGMREAEAPLDSGNSVKLMSVHASKGLEFPAVALPCLGGQLTHNPDRLIFHRSYGLAFNTKRLADDVIPSWYQVASFYDKKMETEERKRLLYVAMTRARDCLGLFIKQSGRSAESYRKWLIAALGLSGDDFTLPDVGASVTLRVQGSANHSNGGGAEFSLSYWFGAPPLDLNSAEPSKMPTAPTAEQVGFELSNNQSVYGFVDDLMDEPPMSVFEAPINELAFVRLTPSGKKHLDAEEDDHAAVFAPRVLGTFFHALMENLPRAKKVDSDWVRDIAYNQGFHFVHPLRLEALVNEGMRLLEIYYGSPLHHLVSGAHRSFNEMPYLMDAGEWIATKRPDLIIEAADGQWYLIDYKTDKFDPAQVARQVRKHSEQLQAYLRDLKNISGIELRAALYFAQFGLLEYLG